MDFEFSDEQELIRAEIRAFLAEHDALAAARRMLETREPFARDLWEALARLGLSGLAIPEEHGGSGGDLELCVVAEEIGRALAPVPFASSVCLAAGLITAAGTVDQKGRYLPALAAGRTVACLALNEGPGVPGPDTLAVRISPAGHLDGCKWPVLDGEAADVAIVAAREGADVSLFIVDLVDPSVARDALDTIDPSRGQARLTFTNAPGERLGPLGGGWPLLNLALQRGAVLAAFEQIGGAERALEMARDYALERTAFGRPIGAFQAIKHKLADMYVALVLARSNALYAAWALTAEPASLPLAAATARVSATQAFQLCARENIQIHGGMGFTWESDCHLYHRRAQHLAVSLGGLSHWQDRLVETLRAAPAPAIKVAA